MDLSDVGELFYITAIDNVPSMLRLGILSHARAARLGHRSIALESVQAIRARKPVPGGRRLHEYANLYICQRNAMMVYVIRNFTPHDSLAVLRISPEVLMLPGVVIADGNAARSRTTFHPSPNGLARLDGAMIHAEWWTRDPDPLVNWEHKRVKQAEVLVPDLVEPAMIRGAYASCGDAQIRLRAIMGSLDVQVVPYVFFR